MRVGLGGLKSDLLLECCLLTELQACFTPVNVPHIPQIALALVDLIGCFSHHPTKYIFDLLPFVLTFDSELDWLTP